MSFVVRILIIVRQEMIKTTTIELSARHRILTSKAKLSMKIIDRSRGMLPASTHFRSSI